MPVQTPNGPYSTQQQQQQPQPHAAPVSPAAGSKNPFMMTNGGGAGLAQPAPAKQHNVSRESMMAVGLEWTNGRHSPDAFASLSARDMR